MLIFLALKTSTTWKILVVEGKIEILKDHFITVGQSGKIVRIKKMHLKNSAKLVA